MSVDPPQPNIDSNDDSGSPSPEGEPTRTVQPEAAVGTPKRIGHYHVKRVLASGGMGTVYEATQEKPRRTVALKLMKHGIASRSALRRFEYESQILARLRHPGIAQVYEAGTHRDDAGAVPFFAMEYIVGAKPITQYVKEKKLGTRERMELFAQVCDAVNHGHQKGIIHRDLKPSNILVDAQGQVKIIDFGVARSTDSDLAVTTLQTDIGQLIGTLQYMSPEQCEADPHNIDTRSDIYALGVVFYELLCGRLPYNVTRVAMHEATRIIREQHPTKLSTLNKTLRGDVETIVLKALEKDRERRYQSATDFGQDIRRYLSNEAITARPPSVLYQFRVLVRRNKPIFGAIAAVFVVLVSGILVSTSLYVKADRAAKRAMIEASKSRQTATFMKEMLKGVGPSVALGRDTTMLREILTQTAARIDKDLEGQPGVEASLRTTIGSAYLALGQYELADDHLRRAEVLATNVFGEANPRTLRTKSLLADLLSLQSRWTEAERYATETLSLRRKVLGDTHPDTLSSANRLGEVMRRLGRFADSERMHGDTLRQRRRVLGLQHPDTLTSMFNLAALYSDQDRFEEAEQLNRDTLATRRQVLGEEHPETLSSMDRVAIALGKLGDDQEAAILHRETLEIKKRVMGDEHPSTLKTMNALGYRLMRQEKYAEAEAVLRKTVEIWRRTLGEAHTSTLTAVQNLAAVLRGQGKLDESRILVRGALDQLKYRAERHDASPAAINEYAWALLTCEHAELRDPKTALTIAKRAVNLSRPPHPYFLDTLARAYFMTGDTARAIETQEKAVSLLPPEESPLRTELEANLAKYRAAAEAEPTDQRRSASTGTEDDSSSRSDDPPNSGG